MGATGSRESGSRISAHTGFTPLTPSKRPGSIQSATSRIRSPALSSVSEHAHPPSEFEELPSAAGHSLAVSPDASPQRAVASSTLYPPDKAGVALVTSVESLALRQDDHPAVSESSPGAVAIRGSSMPAQPEDPGSSQNGLPILGALTEVRRLNELQLLARARPACSYARTCSSVPFSFSPIRSLSVPLPQLLEPSLTHRWPRFSTAAAVGPAGLRRCLPSRDGRDHDATAQGSGKRQQQLNICNRGGSGSRQPHDWSQQRIIVQHRRSLARLGASPRSVGNRRHGRNGQVLPSRPPALSTPAANLQPC